ncbi:uracil-DNA glycosylase [Marinicella sp. W31]|uniref:uracil-DNA glycosylase n=1 Tax=Marinicella sp. W31 TaxID=3023713 RepID=UPI003756F6EC
MTTINNNRINKKAMIRQFMRHMCETRFENVFNPYSDRCAVYDLKQAADVRRKLLTHVVRKARDSRDCDVWIGRDLGYNGGRRTGLPFTDDVHLPMHAQKWDVPASRAVKKTPIIAERSATVIWKILAAIQTPVFIWNVFPWHPHLPDEPFSNRAHTAAERKIGEALLQQLVEIVKPQRIMAIGNTADESLQRLQFNGEKYKLRHPSFGGNHIFTRQISEIYNL